MKIMVLTYSNDKILPLKPTHLIGELTSQKYIQDYSLCCQEITASNCASLLNDGEANINEDVESQGCVM